MLFKVFSRTEQAEIHPKVRLAKINNFSEIEPFSKRDVVRGLGVPRSFLLSVSHQGGTLLELIIITIENTSTIHTLERSVG